MSYKIGQKIMAQKHRFVGLENGPVGPENVGHIVDLCYDRKLKANDKDLHLFFEDSYKQVNSKKNNPTAKIGNNILRVGKRSSSNFFRVYLKSNGKELRFEIELKKIVLKNCIDVSIKKGYTLSFLLDLKFENLCFLKSY